MSEPFTVAIVGSGFSGVMTAIHLLRGHSPRPVRVLMVNRSGVMARGVAYGTNSPAHLLNVPAGKMSALPDDPSHFVRFAQSLDPSVTPGTFVRRSVYGAYLESMLTEAGQESRWCARTDRGRGQRRRTRACLGDDDNRGRPTYYRRSHGAGGGALSTRASERLFARFSRVAILRSRSVGPRRPGFTSLDRASSVDWDWLDDPRCRARPPRSRHTGCDRGFTARALAAHARSRGAAARSGPPPTRFGWDSDLNWLCARGSSTHSFAGRKW